MKLQTAKCTTCGASLKLQVDKTISECSYCKSQIIVSNALDFNKVKLDRSEDIKKYRLNLSKFVKNNSLEEILRASSLIKDIIPEDNLASYYFAYAKQLMSSPKFIYQFYESKHLLTKDELDEIVDHIVEHSDLRDKSRVTSFLEEHDISKVSAYLVAYDNRVIEEDNYSDIPRDIFICFSSENKAVAKKVYETLEDDGYSTWISLKNLRPNNKENYWDDIKKAINNCSIVLVISSGQAMVSKDVIKEIELAKKENKKLIEYKIDEIKHTSFFKYIFDGSKWVEGYNSKGLDNLKKRILEEKYVFKDKNKEKKYDKIQKQERPYEKPIGNKNSKNFILITTLLVLLLSFSLGSLYLFSGQQKTSSISTKNEVDTIAPIVELIGSDSIIIEIGAKFIEPGVIARDNLDDLPEVFIIGEVDTNKVGNYLITYYSIDKNGNKSENKIRNISVIPKVSLNVDLSVTNPKLFMGLSSSAFLTKDSKIYTWGNNQTGQLGLGSTVDQVTPVEISQNIDIGNNDKIVDFVLGFYHSSALTYSGKVFMWGDNYHGQIGDNTSIRKMIPIDISSSFKLDNNDKIVKISLGYHSSLALSDLGRVFSWGSNSNGQLGTITETSKLIPYEITNSFNLTTGDSIIDISLNRDNASAISSYGRIFTWGENNFGQLGDGTQLNKSLPIEITKNFELDEKDRIIKISFSLAGHAAAISDFGEVFTWGRNGGGQLGDNTTINKSKPNNITSKIRLSQDDKITNISLGIFHSSALSLSGKVFTWGSNYIGQLGDGTNINRLIPVDITGKLKIENDDKIVDISLGGEHSAAFSLNGKIFLWGGNDNGQLGDGSKSNKPNPIEVSVR
jgi:alpha-tubulin suppressor-like RCC1 family protein